MSGSGNRFAFTGYEWDPELGLFNAKARYFDPQIGRFISQDSFLGQIDDPPSLHRYFYGNDNPGRFIDPTGHSPQAANTAQGPSQAEVLESLKKDFAEAEKRAAVQRAAETAPKPAVVTEEDHGVIGNLIYSGLRRFGESWAGKKLAQAQDQLESLAKKANVIGKGAWLDRFHAQKSEEALAQQAHRDAQTGAYDAPGQAVLHNTEQTFKGAEQASGEIAGKGAEIATREGVPALAAGIAGRGGRLAGELLEEARASEKIQPLTRILYSMEDAPSAPLRGSRQAAIDRAWAQEVGLVQRAGRGTRPWTAAEIEQIRAGASYRDLGYTGHHVNRVVDAPAWKGDPRNIEFLQQGPGREHMAFGHPGGTRAPQPPGLLIDREAMLRSLGGGVVDAPR